VRGSGQGEEHSEECDDVELHICGGIGLSLEERLWIRRLLRRERGLGKKRLVYRAKQVSMPQPGGCQDFGGPTTQIMVFRAIELKPSSPVELTS